ncbi:MAG: flagellar filament capping protein FliD [Firmicutes bacterium]|nr:flagellar filament capping protein FliD [Bacillota bacterium]
MRIPGLASGLDTENMIKDLMQAERIPVDRVYQKKIEAEWKRDAYRDVNTKLLRLRNMAFDLSLEGAYRVRTASSSREDLISASAGGSSQEGTFTIRVSRLATAAYLQTEAGVDVQTRLTQFFEDNPQLETASFELQGLDGEMEEITVSREESLENILQKINLNKNLGLNAYYDPHTKQVALATKATGQNAVIEAGADNEGFFEQVFGRGSSFTPGTNALLEINGLKTERESNVFELNGTALTLNQASDTVVRIDVAQDIDAVADKIKEFVTLYNELVGELNLSLREEAYRDYPPLTPAQREEMSEKEIELWEERAKSGLLRSDNLVSAALTEMRLAFGAGVEGVEGLGHLSQLGIKTGAWYEYGQLHLDEDKLKAALKEDSEQVSALFAKRGESTQEQGIARRLTAVLDQQMERIVSTAGKATMPYDQSYLGRQIRDYESRIGDLEERLVRVEQSYWDKFTAMEQVLSQLYSQSDWLYQQLAALQGG